MLRGQDRRLWKGTYDLHFEHHDTLESLKVSAGMNCGICRVLLEELTPSESESEQDINPDYNATEAGRPTANTFPTSTASLRVVDGFRDRSGHEIYRLDFALQQKDIRRKRTFVLNQIGRYCPLS